MNNSKSSMTFSWIKPLFIAFIIALFVRTFLFSPYIVDGASMEPTLHDREKILVNKTASWLGHIDRGDIVIIKGNEENVYYVKRVIAVPGDTIVVANDQLFINEEEVDEYYLKENKEIAQKKGLTLTEDLGPIEIPKDRYFVMGDNRQRSLDSRNDLGLIKEDQIIGKSQLVLSPLKHMRVTK